MTPIPQVPDAVRARAQDFIAEVDAASLERIARFLDLLLTANERMNLIRASDAGEIWERHVFDSLAVLPWIDALDPADGARATTLDIGSGGGFPGLPLALARPDRRFVLVETTQKKAKFLAETIATLEATNVRVIAKRAEDLGRDPNHRERYSLVLARAVARLPVLLELALPLVEIGGTFLAMKGEKAADEMGSAKQALKLLGGEASIESLDSVLPGRNACIVAVDKSKRTPPQYPRPAGIPERKPL